MADTVRTCATCGAQHTKVWSWIDATKKTYYFCNMECKRLFFTEVFPKIVRERENAEKQACVLPEVRELIAYKNKDGSVTYVRGNSAVQGRGDTRQN